MDDTYFDAVYLSPHLDDVVLSCGGQLFQMARRGRRILIVTIAAAEPQMARYSTFADYQHQKWQLSAREAVAARRAEDVAAAQKLGVHCLHWSLPDAIYRIDPQTKAPLYTSDEDIFGAVHPVDNLLLGELSIQMKRLPVAKLVVAPLGLGNHVDHQLTRLAAEEVFGNRLAYYEDYPYVQRAPELLEQFVAARQWRSELIGLDQRALEARIAAISEYRSQIKSLFHDADTMERLVRTYVAQVGGERRWRRERAQSSG